MKIDRRSLLSATARLAMMKLVGPAFGYASRIGSVEFPWHPFTRSLLDRARRASSARTRVDTTGVEQVIREMSGAQRYANPPVIKWRADPFEAFAYLSGYGLDALLQMGNARLWRRAGLKADLDDDRLNSHLVLGGVIGDIVRASDHDRLLMAPKLLSKARVMAENPSAEAVFKVRAVAAQIGWLETSLPLAAAQAVTDVELFLSSGAPEESIHHQLNVFEAYELGLLATWETPDVVICVPRSRT